MIQYKNHRRPLLFQNGQEGKNSPEVGNEMDNTRFIVIFQGVKRMKNVELQKRSVIELSCENAYNLSS